MVAYIKKYLLLMVPLLLAACGGDDKGLLYPNDSTPLRIVSLQVTPAMATVPVGFGKQYVAEALLDDGRVIDVTDNPSVSWVSSDSTIAIIDNKGRATGVDLGEVTITATMLMNGQSFSATAALNVTNAVVMSLQVTPETADVPVGFTQQYTAIAVMSDGSSLDVTNDAALSWSSSNANVATISSTGTSDKGLATGVTEGTVTITASGTAYGQSFSATATLNVTNALVTSLQVTPGTADVPVGFTQQYTATAVMSDGSSLDVTNNAALSWSSSDPTTATIISSQVSGNGLATGVKPGTVTITASGTANGQSFSATATLNVNAGPDFNKGCTQGLVTVGSLTYTCPLTREEADANGISYTATYFDNGFEYIRHTWADANAYCTGLNGGFRLPTRDELVALYSAHGNMNVYAGWPTALNFRSSTEYGPGDHYIVNLSSGDVLTDIDSFELFVTCVR